MTIKSNTCSYTLNTNSEVFSATVFYADRSFLRFPISGDLAYVYTIKGSLFY